jgi:hypothetical protein
MMTTQLRRRWSAVSLLVIAVWLLAALIQSDAAYAERQKVSGTSKERTRVGLTRILKENPTGNVGLMSFLANWVGGFSSTDSDWNNVTFYYVTYGDAMTRSLKGYAVTAHPGGEQTFREYEGAFEQRGATGTHQIEGRFLGGTGKFKGITGTWKENVKRTPVDDISEWEAEYEIQQ